MRIKNLWPLLLAISSGFVLESCKETITPQVPPPASAPTPVATPPPVLGPCALALLTGYTDKPSYLPGDEIEVFLQSSATLQCILNIYDVNGSLSFTSNVSMFKQLVAADAPWENGFNFNSSGKIKLPSSLASGVYSIEDKIHFVVKATSASDITILYPTNTINAYNDSGGKSLYGYNSTAEKASPEVSFLRPVDSPDELGFCGECLTWFPSLNNIKIGYIADLDMDDFSSFSQSKMLVIVGHSEYWTRKARHHFDQFVEAGGHSVILSGNVMWWQIRYTNDLTQMICYKDSPDPEPDPSLKTILWADPKLGYSIMSSIGADFNHGGYGLDGDKGWDGYKICNPASPLLEGTGLKKGDVLHLPSDECDGAPIKNFDSNGWPALDNPLGFEKIELIGFDRGIRNNAETFPTFFVMQKTKTSGVIVHAGTINWCSSTGMGSTDSGDPIKKITQNAIVKLLNGVNVFSN